MHLTREHRLLARSYESGPKEFFERWKNDYVNLPAEKQNMIDTTTHATAGALSALTEAPDAAFEWLARKIDGNPQPIRGLDEGITRTGRDSRRLVKEIFSFKLPSALLSATRLPGDVLMDGVDFAIGNDHRMNA